uniref:Uncharacterized protein n=2 Tax=Picea TaxID=3328 RepID=A0A124GMW9_PICGL|nr:hypothetical protein ABT39_MTgene5960 [Picea glauca]QHR91404.1 hypothetical protein Q903MT_gene5438 [Picea sitchensis]
MTGIIATPNDSVPPTHTFCPYGAADPTTTEIKGCSRNASHEIVYMHSSRGIAIILWDSYHVQSVELGKMPQTYLVHPVPKSLIYLVRPHQRN